VLSEDVQEYQIPEEENLIPVFMHGFSAPVNLQYDYSLEELACLILHASDPFIRWEAGQNYSLLAVRQAARPDLFKPYVEALKSPQLTPLAKAQLLQIPSIRAIAQKYDDYDFIKLKQTRKLFVQELSLACKPALEQLLKEHPEPAPFEPTSLQMQVRELRGACWQLLADIDPAYAEKLVKNYHAASNFDTSFASFKTFTNLNSPLKEGVIVDFYNKWKNDKVVFNFWLSAQASSNGCTVSDLKKLMTIDGYDAKNPNHIRSVLRSFISNLGEYHDPKGEGYAFIVGQILEIGTSNPILAHNNLAVPAFIDFEKMPDAQQAVMIREMKRLLAPTAPPETRDLVKKMLASKG
jgi:aminopeptidase N